MYDRLEGNRCKLIKETSHVSGNLLCDSWNGFRLKCVLDAIWSSRAELPWSAALDEDIAVRLNDTTRSKVLHAGVVLDVHHSVYEQLFRRDLVGTTFVKTHDLLADEDERPDHRNVRNDGALIVEGDAPQLVLVRWWSRACPHAREWLARTAREQNVRGARLRKNATSFLHRVQLAALSALGLQNPTR